MASSATCVNAACAVGLFAHAMHPNGQCERPLLWPRRLRHPDDFAKGPFEQNIVEAVGIKSTFTTFHGLNTLTRPGCDGFLAANRIAESLSDKPSFPRPAWASRQRCACGGWRTRPCGRSHS